MRRLLITILIFLQFSYSSFSVVARDDVYQKGDVDCNGYFTVNDIVIISNIILGYQNNLSDEVLSLADCNGDGLITVNDIVYVSNRILNNTVEVQEVSIDLAIYDGFSYNTIVTNVTKVLASKGVLDVQFVKVVSSQQYRGIRAIEYKKNSQGNIIGAIVEVMVVE